MNKLILILSVVLATAASCLPGSISEASSGEIHPCVYLTPQEVTAVRQRYQTQPWAHAIGTQILQKANAALAQTPDIPHAGGQWAGHYACPACGTTLEYVSASTHICKKCGHTYSGGLYDKVGIEHRHHQCFHNMFDLALAYVLDPRPECAKRIRETLLEYASFYPTLPLHDYLGQKGAACLARGARLSAQTLDESHLLVKAVRAYDLVYNDSCFGIADRECIEKNLIRSMVATIQRNPWGILNWQSEHNAAMASAGYLLHDAALIDQALNDADNGFRFQMKEGVLDSGMWYEGSIGYHFGALNSHIALMEAAFRNGTNLYELPQVKKMFLAPLNMLLPNGTFPPLNDSHLSATTDHRAAYEVAYQRYADPRFCRLLEPRDTKESLFWGADKIFQETTQPILTSQAGSAEGCAILRDASGKTALYLDYFKSTAQHTQPTRLHILLYAHDDILFVDPATMPYGHPMHEGWGRQTFAHNTVVVNEQMQDKSEGELHAFESKNGWTIARAQARAAYPGVVLDRTVLLYGNVIADVFRCSAEKSSTFDLPLHMRGELMGLPDGRALPQLSTSPGYCEIKDVKLLEHAPEQFFLNTSKGRRVAVSIFDHSQTFTARGYGNDLSDMVPMLVRRQSGTTADFVALYQLLEPDEKPVETSAECNEVIKLRFGNSQLSVGRNGVAILDNANLRLQRRNRWLFNKAFANRPKNQNFETR